MYTRGVKYTFDVKNYYLIIDKTKCNMKKLYQNNSNTDTY